MDIGTIEAALKLRDDASAALAKFQKNLGNLGTTGREVGEALSRIGIAVTAGVGVPLVAVIKSAKDFESAFANVVKTVEGFDVDAFGNLKNGAAEFREQILNLSRDIPETADKLANIAAVGGQFGIAKGDLLGFTETVAKLGVAIDGIEAETAAEALAQIGNVTGEGTAGISKYADVLVDLGNKGNSTEGEILEFAKRLAGAGHQAGLSGDQIFGLGAAMANVGLNAEAGGTAMSRLLSNMSRAGAEGAEASQKFADFAGRIDATVASGAQFAELFQRDAQAALTLFFDGLSDAAKSGQNLNVILSDLGVNEVRQRDTVLRLAGAQGELAKQFGNAATAAREGTALNEEARKKYATFDNQLQLFLNSVRLVAIEIGTPLLTALKNVLQQLKPVTDGMIDLARAFADLPPAVQTGVVVLGGGAGLTGVLLILSGQIVKTVVDLGTLASALKAMAGTGTAAVAVATSVKASTNAFAGLAAVTDNAFAGLVGVETGLAGAATAAGGAKTAVAGFGGVTAGAAAGIAGLATVAVGLRYAIEKLTDGMGLLGGVMRVAAAPTTVLTELFKGAVEIVSRASGVMADLATVVQDRVARGFTNVVTALTPAITAVKAIADHAATLGTSLTTKVVTGLEVFYAIVTRTVPGVQQLATAVAFVTGKSSEWAAQLHASAEAIRNAKAAADEQVKVTNVLSAAQVEAGLAASHAAQAQQQAVDTQKKSREELDRLLAAVKALDPAQRALIDGWRAAGAGADEISKKTGIAEAVIAAYEKAADRAATAQTKLAKETAIASDAFVQFAKDGIGAVEARLQAIGALDATTFDEMSASILDLNKQIRATGDAIDIRAMSKGLSKELAQLVKDTREFERELEDLADAAKRADPEMRAFYDRLIDLKHTNFDQTMEEAVHQTDEFRSMIQAVVPATAAFFAEVDKGAGHVEKAKEKTKDWTTALSGVAQAFAQLKQLGGGFGFAAELVAQADVALQSFGKVREGIKEFAKGAQADLTAAFADMAAGIASGLAGVIGATDPSKDLGSRLLGGALQGASLGASVGATIGASIASSAAQGAAYGGAWGAAAGVIVGIMIAVFRGRKTRREMEIVGAEWGTDISKGLYDKIKKSQDELFGGDRGAAALFNFSDILKEAGGLNALNFDQFTARLRDVFVALETGAFTTEQALHVIEENFDAFAQHVIQSGEFASEQFLELMRLAETAGLDSDAIQGFVGGRAAAVGQGLAALLGPVIEGSAKIGERVAEARAALEKLAKDGKVGTDEWSAATSELTEALRHQAEVAAGASGDIENIGVVALAMFTRARAAGLTFVEALNAIGPSLDALIVAQQNLGIEGSNAAINQLLHYRELANQFPTLVAAASALGPTLVALQQAGGLTAESLKALEDQGLRTFNRLRDAGFTQNEALAQMADFLKSVLEAHKRLGTPIDANTQALIDQARAAGLLGDEAVSATEQQRRGFEMVTKAINQLIVTLGGVPIAIEDVSQAIESGIPKDINVGIHFDVDDLPDIPNDFPTQRPPGYDPYDTGEGQPPATGPGGLDYDAMWDPAAVERATAAAAAGYSPEVVVPVELTLDGEVVTRVVARRLPEYTELYGGPSSRTTV